MKKKYITPELDATCIESEDFLAESFGIIGDNGIGYGGVDNGGTGEPSVKEHRDLWKEEW